MPALRWLVEQRAPKESLEALAGVLPQRMQYGSLSCEDAKVVQRMVGRQRHVAAGGALGAWLRWWWAAAAWQWWAWLLRVVLGWWWEGSWWRDLQRQGCVSRAAQMGLQGVGHLIGSS